MFTHPYLTMGRFLRERFGRQVFKIGVDAGFSCPHRNANRRSGGCSFCSPEGSRSPLIGCSQDITRQIGENARYWHVKYPDCGLLLYFQAYTSTLAPAAALSEIYQGGLAAGDFCGLVVGTRPDCVPDEVIDVLRMTTHDSRSGSAEREVWVELGLQTAHESSLLMLNRGHGTAEYADAARRLAAANIPVIPHLIFGIPGEGEAERQYTLQWVLENTPSIIGIKIHNLILLPGTGLHERWQLGQITPWHSRDHLDAVLSFLPRVPSDLAIMRLTADIPPQQLTDSEHKALPNELWPNTVFIGRVQKRMKELDIFQGMQANIATTQAVHAVKSQS